MENRIAINYEYEGHGRNNVHESVGARRGLVEETHQRSALVVGHLAIHVEDEVGCSP